MMSKGSKKKLVLISESMSGGLRKHLVQLIENLNVDQFDIFLIHGNKNMDSSFLEKYDGLKKRCNFISCEYFVREVNISQDLKAFKFILNCLKEIKPDIVHCHSSKAGVIGRLAAKKINIEKIFYTPHAYAFLSPEFSKQSKLIFTLIEIILSRMTTTKTFCVSKGEREAALQKYIDNPKKIAVIYNGLPKIPLPKKELIKTNLGLNPENFVIGNNARMSKQKNPIVFFQIAKKIIERDDNYHFVWAGDGELMDEMKEFVSENSLENNIHLLGDRNDTEILVAGYDIFMMTSLYEGLPYAPIEALRAGVPIYSTNVVGSNEVVVEGKTGYFITDSVLSDCMKLFELKNIKTFFDIEFSMENMIEKICTEYYREKN